VDDRQREDGEKLLTAREREALQELATAVVKEASFQPEPETTQKRDALKSYTETFRHLGTLSGATTAGVLLLHESLHITGSYVVVTSLLLLGLAFLGALLFTVLATVRLERDLSEYEDFRDFAWATLLIMSLIATALSVLTGLVW
jgi:hypothetical protein